MNSIQPVSNRPQIYFLGGMPRSGTTWLRNMIGSDRRIFFTAELHLFDHYIVKLQEVYDKATASAGSSELGALFSAESFETNLLAPFARTVIAALTNAAPADCKVVLEKTPANLLHWEAISRFCPEARFIIIRRDPRSVCASFKAAADHDWGSWARKSMEKVATSWILYESELRRLLAAYGDRVAVVNYEDLHQYEADELRRIWSFMKLEADRDSLQRIFDENRIAKHKQLPSSDPRYTHLEDFYRRGEVASWMDELSVEEISMIEAVCANAGIDL